MLYPSRRVLLGGLAFSLFEGSALLAQDTTAAHALVIGISYQSARPGLQLGNTRNDAALIESQFRRLHFQSVLRVDDPRPVLVSF